MYVARNTVPLIPYVNFLRGNKMKYVLTKKVETKKVETKKVTVGVKVINEEIVLCVDGWHVLSLCLNDSGKLEGYLHSDVGSEKIETDEDGRIILETD